MNKQTQIKGINDGSFAGIFNPFLWQRKRDVLNIKCSSFFLGFQKYVNQVIELKISQVQLTLESFPEFHREAFLQMAKLPTHLLA